MLVHALRTCSGVLTRERLREFSGAARWPDHNFEMAIRRGVSGRRITKLDDELYELGEIERDAS